MLQRSEGLDRVFSALSDPTRRAMVERLTRGQASVSELAEPLDMSLSAVVQHLRQLEESGLVVSRKTGRVRMCRIEPRRLKAAQSWLARQRAVWEARFDRMDQFLLDREVKDVEPKA
jgi:DNA-binding transcriptional ArsR family regulator